MQIVDTAQHVVVWDPEGDYWEGGVVDFTLARRLRTRGVVTLPVVPDMFKWSGVGGWAKRAWGAGIPLDSHAPRLVGPLTLFCIPDVRGLTWAARLVPDVREDGGRVDKGRKPEGMVRFSADSGQRVPIQSAYNEVDERAVLVRDFAEPDAHGGWTVGGAGHVSIGTEGHYGYALYATAPGLRVAWVAASTSPMRF